MSDKKVDASVRFIEAAVDIFDKYGFEEATFQQISKKCGVSQPALYNHFKNKMDLLNACAIYSAQLGRIYIDSKADVNIPAKERLISYLKANLDWFAHNKKYASTIVAVYYFAGMNQDSKKLFDLLQSTAMERIRQILNQGVREKSWKLAVSNGSERLIHSLLVGELYKIIYEDDLAKVSESMQCLMAVVESVLKTKLFLSDTQSK